VVNMCDNAEIPDVLHRAIPFIFGTAKVGLLGRSGSGSLFDLVPDRIHLGQGHLTKRATG
jgi:hypothetical protein